MTDWNSPPHDPEDSNGFSVTNFSAPDGDDQQCEFSFTQLRNDLPGFVTYFRVGAETGTRYRNGKTSVRIELPPNPSPAKATEHCRIVFYQPDKPALNFEIWIWCDSDCKIMFSLDQRNDHSEPLPRKKRSDPSKKTLAIGIQKDKAGGQKPWIVGEVDIAEEGNGTNENLM